MSSNRKKPHGHSEPKLKCKSGSEPTRQLAYFKETKTNRTTAATLAQVWRTGIDQRSKPRPPAKRRLKRTILSRLMFKTLSRGTPSPRPTQSRREGERLGRQ